MELFNKTDHKQNNYETALHYFQQNDSVNILEKYPKQASFIGSSMDKLINLPNAAEALTYQKVKIMQNEIIIQQNEEIIQLLKELKNK